MHNFSTWVMPISNYIMSIKYFWKLYNMNERKSELITDVLNLKDKQFDELAEWFYSSCVLKCKVY